MLKVKSIHNANNGRYSIEELERMAAKNLPSYEGGDFLKRGIKNTDPWLEFGSSDITNPAASQIRYKFSITNASTVADDTRTGLLNAPVGMQGRIVEGSFGSVEDNDKTLTSSGKTRALDFFNRFGSRTQMLVTQIQLRTEDEEQFNEIFTMFEDSFSKIESSRFIDPQNDQDEYVQKEKIITIRNRPFILGPDNWLSMPIISGNTLTVSIWISILQNDTVAFKNKLEERGVNVNW